MGTVRHLYCLLGGNEPILATVIEKRDNVTQLINHRKQNLLFASLAVSLSVKICGRGYEYKTESTVRKIRENQRKSGKIPDLSRKMPGNQPPDSCTLRFPSSPPEKDLGLDTILSLFQLNPPFQVG